MKTIFFLFFTSTCLAQYDYKDLQIKPKFSEGDFFEYLKDQISENENFSGFVGLVNISITISKTGIVSNVKIEGLKNLSLKEQLINIISVTKWSPGRSNETTEVVDALYSFSLKF